jgi:hypothetical protein
MRTKQRISATLLAFVLGIGSLTLAAAKPAQASRNSEKLWRYGTYLGTLGTGAALLKNKDTWALVGAGVTALSYSQWKKSVNRRHRAERAARVAAYNRARRARTLAAARSRRARAVAAARARRIRAARQTRRTRQVARVPVRIRTVR